MRSFKVYSGEKPSSADSATYFTVAYGDSKTNVAYYILGPQTSIVELFPPDEHQYPTLTSDGQYTAYIDNPNDEDAIFIGDLYWNGTKIKSYNVVIPANQYAIFTAKGSISFGVNSVEIMNAQLLDVGYGLTTESQPLDLAEAIYRVPCTVTIPALQDGIASVIYTYKDGNTGYTTTTGASSSSRTIQVAYGTTLSYTATAESTYLVDNNKSSSFTGSQVINGHTSTSAIYACFKTPTWSAFSIGTNSIITAVTNNTGVSASIYTQRMTSSSYNVIADSRGPYTVSNGKTDQNTFDSLSSSTTYYFRAYCAARGNIRQSAYITKSATTSSSSST